MVLKVYLNYIGPPQYSKVFKLLEEVDTSGSVILQSFVEAYNSKFKTELDEQLTAESVSLITEQGKQIDLSKSISKVVPSGCYLTVVVENPKKLAGVTEQVYHTRQPTPEPPDVQPGIVSSRGPTDQAGLPTVYRPNNTATPLLQEPAFVVPFLRKAQDAEDRQHYRMAATIYQQVLNASPKNKDALARLISLWRKVKKVQVGLDLSKQAINYYPEDPSLWEQYASSLKDSGKKQEALQAYKTALSLAAKSSSQAIMLRIKVATAGLQLSMGGQFVDVAAAAVMQVLGEDDSHPGALFLYASIAQSRGLLADATRVFLRILIKDQDNAEIKLHLAQCLQTEEGMALVKQELRASNGEAACFAFLATAVKDHGAIPTCIQLFQMAVSCQPSSPSYALNLMHAHELQQDYWAAVQVAISFCRASRLALGAFRLEQAAAILEGLPEPHAGHSRPWLLSDPWQPAKLKQLAFPTSSDQDLATEALLSRAQLSENTAIRPEPACKGPLEQVEYGSEELDALALLFTAVKVLYLGGAIARVFSLVHLLDEPRRASRKPLHTTFIRNEAAYFSCIAQLLCEKPPPPTPSSLRPLFLCGDSHTLSGGKGGEMVAGAWHSLSVRGEPRLLVPLLVTGCKIWHLRPAGRFYPKMAFLATMRALPKGSQMIFMFGEIDCREGLLLAVDKLKYDTMAEAMDVLIGIYVRLLLDLVQQHDFEIFVHPVPSVLNETRHVVQPFNAALKTEIQKAAKCPQALSKLHWLDLFDKLLTQDKLRMNPSLQFDGTHMNPGYVKIIEDSLQNL